MNPFSAYRKWRHSKGFGVHSPYAYRFVSDVIRPGRYGFYAYERVEPVLLKKGIRKYHSIPLIHFIIRLANFLRAKRIVALNVSDSLCPEIAAKAMEKPFNIIQKSEFSFLPGDFLIIDDNHPSSLPDSAVEELTLKAIESQIPILGLYPSPGIKKILESPIENGVLFNGGNKQVLIPRKEMEYVCYETTIKFR